MVTHREGAVESCLTSAAELVDKDPYQLTSHILDISRGIGAKNVKLRFTYYLLMLIVLAFVDTSPTLFGLFMAFF
jgi:hypothetical protein